MSTPARKVNAVSAVSSDKQLHLSRDKNVEFAEVDERFQKATK